MTDKIQKLIEFHKSARGEIKFALNSIHIEGYNNEVVISKLEQEYKDRGIFIDELETLL